MARSIDRRTFIRRSSLAGMAGVLVSGSAAGSLINAADEKAENAVRLSYSQNGNFRILQLTDTHYISGDRRSAAALYNINAVLDAEKPDLVIHTGDLIFGKPAEESIREVLEPLERRGIPFAVTFGNHDDENDKTRKELFSIVRSMKGSLISTTGGIHGVSNYILTLGPRGSENADRVLYILDSNAYSTIEGIDGYDHIQFDQIGWYRNASMKFTSGNGGKPVPSLAFFHIPLPEMKEAVSDGSAFMRGTKGEEVCSPAVNSGLFVSMKEMGDIQAVFFGHDHNNDFAVYWNSFFFIYGRFSGCDTVYNDLKPGGARVIELTEGEKSFRSWIRLADGMVIQDLKYPDDFIRKKES